MNYSEKWEVIGEEGRGGQGIVYRVYEKSTETEDDRKIAVFLNKIRAAGVDRIQLGLNEFFELVHRRLARHDLSNIKALKTLHKPEDAREAESAEKRVVKEMRAMAEMSHKHLLRLIDYDLDDKWFVTDYYSNGTLAKRRDCYCGNIEKTLHTFLPLVEGVAEIHDKGSVHRDIKPENIFIDANENLVLGDFGLVFLTQDESTRVSKTFENVGSRDWMPTWKYSQRDEEPNAKFDVFGLGKVLWSMLSGKPVLKLWYFEKNDNNLEQIFPDNQGMHFINELLRKCVVEEEDQCEIADASVFLDELLRIRKKIEMGAGRVPSDRRPCKVCGEGFYACHANEYNSVTNFGLQPRNYTFMVYLCSNCGHVEMFAGPGGMPPLWKKASE